jgi:hypothetical protein
MNWIDDVLVTAIGLGMRAALSRYALVLLP